MSAVTPLREASTKPTTTVREMARNLRVDFRPGSLQLSVVQLARHVESLQGEVALLRSELRRPLWRRLMWWRSPS
jgi:hypothetical protein